MLPHNPQLDHAFRTGKPRVLLCFIDHPDGVVRVWSRTGTRVFTDTGVPEIDGYEWRGLGIAGRITGATSSVPLQIKQVTFELAGVPPKAAAYLSGKVRNRVGKVWFGALDGRRLIPNPDLVVDSVLDYQKLAVQDNGTCTIRILGNIGFFNLTRASNRAWTHERQQIRFPGDVGLSLIPELGNKEVRWRKTD